MLDRDPLEFIPEDLRGKPRLSIKELARCLTSCRNTVDRMRMRGELDGLDFHRNGDHSQKIYVSTQFVGEYLKKRSEEAIRRRAA